MKVLAVDVLKKDVLFSTKSKCSKAFSVTEVIKNGFSETLLSKQRFHISYMFGQGSASDQNF